MLRREPRRGRQLPARRAATPETRATHGSRPLHDSAEHDACLAAIRAEWAGDAASGAPEGTTAAHSASGDAGRARGAREPAAALARRTAAACWDPAHGIAELPRGAGFVNAGRGRRQRNNPGKQKEPPPKGWLFLNGCPAASYSPTPWRVQYHRR